MSGGGASRAAPRVKQPKFQDQRYRVTEVPHFINGRLEPVGAIVVLPEGVKPGRKLVAVGTDGEAQDVAPTGDDGDTNDAADPGPAKNDKPAKGAK